MNRYELKKLASHCKAVGDFPQAIEHLHTALRDAIDANPLDVASMNNSLADLYLKMDDARAAELPARKSVNIELEFGNLGRETTHLADYSATLARVLEAQYRYDEASYYASKAVSIFSDLLGADNDFTKGIIDYQKHLYESRWKG